MPFTLTYKKPVCWVLTAKTYQPNRIRKDGVTINTSDIVENITVYQRINPDDTVANTACIEVNENEETEDYRTNNGLSPNFSIEGKSLEKLIAVLAKIV